MSVALVEALLPKPSAIGRPILKNVDPRSVNAGRQQTPVPATVRRRSRIRKRSITKSGTDIHQLRTHDPFAIHSAPAAKRRAWFTSKVLRSGSGYLAGAQPSPLRRLAGSARPAGWVMGLRVVVRSAAGVSRA